MKTQQSPSEVRALCQEHFKGTLVGNLNPELLEKLVIELVTKWAVERNHVKYPQHCRNLLRDAIDREPGSPLFLTVVTWMYELIGVPF